MFQFQSNEMKCVHMEINNKSEKNGNKRNWWINSSFCFDQNQNQHSLHVAILDDTSSACVRCDLCIDIDALVFGNKSFVCKLVDYLILVGQNE